MRHIFTWSFELAAKCFNPRIRKGCDSKGVVYDNKWQVSIHASVKDATQGYTGTSFATGGFNPRIRKGCDPRFVFKVKDFLVSIHASVKDATYLYRFVI